MRNNKDYLLLLLNEHLTNLNLVMKLLNQQVTKYVDKVALWYVVVVAAADDEVDVVGIERWGSVKPIEWLRYLNVVMMVMMMKRKLNPKMRMQLMNHLNLNLNYRDLNTLKEVYLMMHRMLVEIDQRMASSK